MTLPLLFVKFCLLSFHQLGIRKPVSLARQISRDSTEESTVSFYTVQVGRPIASAVTTISTTITTITITIEETVTECCVFFPLLFSHP
jgi:hypothetical protein